MVFLLTLICSIIGLWIIAGRYEWQIPAHLANKIIRWMGTKKEQEMLDAIVVNIEAREFITESMEKEIYIVRKSRKHKTDHLLMNVDVQIGQKKSDTEEIARAKLRLEKRFPGLTVNFAVQEQE